MIQDPALQKPPRLVQPDAPGAYHWRELDIWLNKVYRLLSNGANQQSLNVFNELDSLSSLSFATSVPMPHHPDFGDEQGLAIQRQHEPKQGDNQALLYTR